MIGADETHLALQATIELELEAEVEEAEDMEEVE